MYRSLRHLFFATACASSAMFACQESRATILTFGITPHPGFTAGGFQGTYATYGDNVTGLSAPGPLLTTYDYGMGNAFTPNIAVSYSHVDNAPAGSTGNSPHPTAAGWSDPVNYLHHQAGDFFWITFTPTGQFGVTINSFAIDLFAGSGTLTWKLRQGSTVGPIFASGTELALSVLDPDRIVNIPNGTFFGTTVLEIDFTGSTGNIGIDDLNFDQILVPEPSTFALLGLGLIPLVRRKRRRRSRS